MVISDRRMEESCGSSNQQSPFTYHYSRCLFPHGGRFLPLARAQEIQLGAPGVALFFHFHFGDARRMDWKHALDPFTVGNATHGESLVQAGAFAANNDTAKNLDAFLVAFAHPGMDAHAVAHAKLRHVALLLF